MTLVILLIECVGKINNLSGHLHFVHVSGKIFNNTSAQMTKSKIGKYTHITHMTGAVPYHSGAFQRNIKKTKSTQGQVVSLSSYHHHYYIKERLKDYSLTVYHAQRNDIVGDNYFK